MLIGTKTLQELSHHLTSIGDPKGTVELAFGSRKLRHRKKYKSGTFSLDVEARFAFTDPSGQTCPAT